MTASDVLANAEGAAEHILSQAAECLGGTHRQPIPEKGGEIESAVLPIRPATMRWWSPVA